MEEKLKCRNCGSENIEIVEQLDEGEQVLKSYAECRDCGNAWALDSDDDPNEE